MAAVQRLEHPGWCRNILGAARIEAGERVLVLVDEPLVEEGAQLLAAVKDAGAEPRLELWAGKRPLASAPPAVKEAARESKLLLFLAQAPRGDEASARFETSEVITRHGGRGIFLGFVDGDLLRGELSKPGVDLSEDARRLLAELEGSREVRVRGGAAQALRELVADAGRGADVIAELGIGINPNVEPSGHVMLDEKALRTAHVPIGRNTGSYGGDNEAEIHVDCVFSAPQVEADGRPIQLP